MMGQDFTILTSNKVAKDASLQGGGVTLRKMILGHYSCIGDHLAAIIC